MWDSTSAWPSLCCSLRKLRCGMQPSAWAWRMHIQQQKATDAVSCDTLLRQGEEMKKIRTTSPPKASSEKIPSCQKCIIGNEMKENDVGILTLLEKPHLLWEPRWELTNRHRGLLMAFLPSGFYLCFWLPGTLQGWDLYTKQIAFAYLVSAFISPRSVAMAFPAVQVTEQGEHGPDRQGHEGRSAPAHLAWTAGIRSVGLKSSKVFTALSQISLTSFACTDVKSD